jgi:hypothetical protein
MECYRMEFCRMESCRMELYPITFYQTISNSSFLQKFPDRLSLALPQPHLRLVYLRFQASLYRALRT